MLYYECPVYSYVKMRGGGGVWGGLWNIIVVMQTKVGMWWSCENCIASSMCGEVIQIVRTYMGTEIAYETIHCIREHSVYVCSNEICQV